MDAQGSQTIGVGRTALAATFAGAAASYWTSVFPCVARHVARWRRAARQVPDPRLRRLVEASLAKRSNIEGAAAFAAFAPRRYRREATLALSAFQAAYNLLDILGEQPSEDPIADGRRLHEALLYALSPDGSAGPSPDGSASAPLDDGSASGRLGDGSASGPLGDGSALAPRRDWYELHPLREDGGYLNGLLEDCRRAAGGLPSFAAVAPAAREAAQRIVAFQSFNLSEAQGDHSALEHWAHEVTPPGSGLQWWETAAAAGSSLGVHVLIGAAAETGVDGQEASALGGAYFPWIGALHSLLDNLVDKHEDAAAGHRSFVAYYSSTEETAERLCWLAQRAMEEAQALPHSARHVVLVAALIGNYLSAPEVQTPSGRALATRLLARTGPLATPTMLVFKLRRLGLVSRPGLDSFG